MLVQLRTAELAVGLSDPFPFLAAVVLEDPAAEAFLTDYTPQAVHAVQNLAAVLPLGDGLAAPGAVDTASIRARTAHYKGLTNPCIINVSNNY